MLLSEFATKNTPHESCIANESRVISQILTDPADNLLSSEKNQFFSTPIQRLLRSPTVWKVCSYTSFTECCSRSQTVIQVFHPVSLYKTALILRRLNSQKGQLATSLHYLSWLSRQPEPSQLRSCSQLSSLVKKLFKRKASSFVVHFTHNRTT